LFIFKLVLYFNAALQSFVQDCGMDAGLQCPVCFDTVCTIYGLWFHITKRHPNQSTSHWSLRCPICHTVFKGLEKLDRHIHASHLEMDLTPHQSSSDEDDKASGDAAKKVVATSKSFSSLLSTCPQEMMMQLDFSCTKFALVAQISAEQVVSVRRTTKASANCHACDRTFSCTACGVCFVSEDQHREHMMLTHDAPQVIAEFLRSSEDADPRAGRLTREEFLLVLGLKALPVTDDALEVVTPQSATKVVNVDANQNLLKMSEVPPTVSTTMNLAAPLVVAPLMALTAPMTSMFPSTVPVPVPSVIPHDLSSHAVTPSVFRFISASSAMTFLNAGGSNSIQSIATMTGTFPFLSPFLPPASVERHSPAIASNLVKNSARDASLLPALAGTTALHDGGTKSSTGSSDAEESSKTSMYIHLNQ